MINNHAQCVWLQSHYTTSKVTARRKSQGALTRRCEWPETPGVWGIACSTSSHAPWIQRFCTLLIYFWGDLLNTTVQNRVVYEHIRFKVRLYVLTCCFFFSCFWFLGLNRWYMEIPRPGVKSSCSHRLTPQPQQLRLWPTPQLTAAPDP